jgi:hypothetical protein
MILATFAAGGAVDLLRAANVKTRLLAAADSATLGAIATNSSGFTGAAQMGGDGAVDAGQQQALQIFAAQSSTMSRVTVSDVNVAVSKDGLTLSSSLQFTAQVPTFFLSLIKIPTLTVTGRSVATNNLPTFMDFYLYLDNSPSMGVAATLGDIAVMVNNTPDRCAFACHDTTNNNNYYNLARRLAVTLRIDVLRQATQQLMDTAASTASVPGQYRMAINTFNINVQTISALTSDLSSAKALAVNIDLLPVPGQNWNNDQDTSFFTALTSANHAIPTSGTGASSLDTQKIMFFVSDGVGDDNVGGVRTIARIDPTLCTTIKVRGIKIAVLYTTYLPLPTNAFYNAHVAPWADEIGPAMQSCASPGLYFEVNPTQGISAALQALFFRVLGEARLSQ